MIFLLQFLLQWTCTNMGKLTYVAHQRNTKSYCPGSVLPIVLPIILPLMPLSLSSSYMSCMMEVMKSHLFFMGPTDTQTHTANGLPMGHLP